MISPVWGFHLFANSDDPAGALNRTPFGLIANKELLFIFAFFQCLILIWYLQFAFPLVWGRSANNSCFSISKFLRYVKWAVREAICKKGKGCTLCLRYEPLRPGWRSAWGSRRMMPSPPLSITSWKKDSRCAISRHTSFSAKPIYLHGCSFKCSTIVCFS